MFKLSLPSKLFVKIGLFVCVATFASGVLAAPAKPAVVAATTSAAPPPAVALPKIDKTSPPATILTNTLQKVLPSVVNIRADIKITDLSILFELQKQYGIDLNKVIPDNYLSIGSGVIVDAAKGYIITNAHVVNDAQTIVVTLGDGRHYTGKLIGLDKASDVALLQIKAQNLTAITFADSSNLKVGDQVAAIGNPFGLNQSVSSGIISALGRNSLGIENIENFIQTDAPINPGNSGGALINQRGELIGINTAILAPDRGNVGIGFAVPTNIVFAVLEQLIKYGDVKRGALGIGVQDISPTLADALHLTGPDAVKGAVVTLTQYGSPAQKSGIIVGDIIRSVNNIPIKDANDLVAMVGFLRVDTKLNMMIDRNKNHINISTILMDPKKLKEIEANIDPFFFGVGMQNFYLLSPTLGEVKGIMVVSVAQDSHAWQADLRAGDVIVSVDGQKTETITDMQRVASRDKSSIVLNVLRGNSAVFLIIAKENI